MATIRVRPLVAMALAAFVAVACAGGMDAPASASPAASAAVASTAPTARPTPRPTPRRTAIPSPTPEPSVAPDVAAGLKIASPYKLVANPANKSLSASIAVDIAGKHVTETISGREIHNRGSLLGTALVLRLDGVAMSKEVFEGGARGAAANVDGTLEYTTIAGTRVAIVRAKAGTIGLFRWNDDIVMVVGEDAADTKPLLTSVIKANR
jgi:hypothetical protein